MTALLSNAACALVLGIPPQSLRIKRMKGTGPPFTRLGGLSSKAYYKLEDVEKWIADRPTFVSTMDERRAAHAAAQAAKPPKTRKRLVHRQVSFAAPLSDSKRGAARPSRSGAGRPRKSR